MIGIIAYLVAELFVEIYLVACYAILHCYYVDLKLSKEANGLPRNAPQELKRFLKQEKTEYEEVEVDDSFDSEAAREEAKEYK